MDKENTRSESNLVANYFLYFLIVFEPSSPVLRDFILIRIIFFTRVPLPKTLCSFNANWSSYLFDAFGSKLLLTDQSLKKNIKLWDSFVHFVNLKTLWFQVINLKHLIVNA